MDFVGGTVLRDSGERPVSRKDLDEKLEEARGIMHRAELMGRNASPIPLTGAGVWLVEEVDRLRKIEEGLENLIAMKKQVHATLVAQRKVEIKADYWYGMNGAIELAEKANQLEAEWEPLEALLDGQ